MIDGRLERGAAVLAAATVCALGAAANEQHNAPAPQAHAAYTAPASTLHPTDPLALGGYNKINFKIYPVTLDSPGFSPAHYTPHMLEEKLQGGWNVITRAAGSVSTVATIETKQEQTIAVPELMKVPDLCDAEIRNNFADDVIDAAVTGPPSKDRPGEKTIPVVVIEQEEAVSCVNGSTSREGPIFIYDGNQVQKRTYAHEIAHNLAASGHDHSIGCETFPAPEIGADCAIYSTGDTQTIMGKSGPEDADPLNAYSLMQLGDIKPEQVASIYNGEPTDVILRSIATKTKEGIRVVRIPIAGVALQDIPRNPNGNVDVPAHPKSKKELPSPAGQLLCSDAVVLELSTEQEGTDINKPYDDPFTPELSIKGYITLSDHDKKMLDTIKMAAAPDDNGNLTYTVGGNTIHVDVHDIRKSLVGTGEADLTVTVTAGKQRRSDECN